MPEPEQHHKRLDDLGHAVTAFLQHRQSGGDTDSFVADHGSWRQLLEPLLVSGQLDQLDESTYDGRHLGEFLLLREIGRGGMGVVYEAHDTALRRRVALKVLPREFDLDQKRLERFLREAAAAARLRHDSILPVYSIGEQDGTHYFAMEFVEGQGLDQHIAAAAADRCAAGLGYRQVAQLLAEVASGLQAAHDGNVLHRDIKPANILVTESGHARLVDFGLAKDLDRASISRSMDVAGTPQYMSPEQVSGLSQVDQRSDVFSLGVVFYECLTLRRPFDGSTTQQTLHAIHKVEPTPIHRINRDAPKDLATICQQAMRKAPGERYSSAEAMATDLHRFLDDRPLEAQPPSSLSRLFASTRRNRAAVLTVTLLALLTVAVWLVIGQQQRAERNLERTRRVLRQQIERLADVANHPGTEDLHQRLTEDVLASVEQLQETERDVETSALVVVARDALARVLSWRDDHAAAHVQLDRIRTELAWLRKNGPLNAKLQSSSATERTARAVLWLGDGLYQQAAQALQEGIDIWTAVLECEPQTKERDGTVLRCAAAAVHLTRTNLLFLGFQPESKQRARESHDLAARMLASIPTPNPIESALRTHQYHQFNESILQRRDDQEKASRLALDKAVQLGRQRLDRFPTPRAKRDLAKTLNDRAVALANRRQGRKAHDDFVAANQLLRDLTQNWPKTRSFRRQLVRNLAAHAKLLGQSGKEQLARQRLREAHALTKELPLDGHIHNMHVLARLQQAHGLLELSVNNLDAAEQHLQTVLTNYRKADNPERDSAEGCGLRASAHQHLALVSLRRGKQEQGRRQAVRAAVLGRQSLLRLPTIHHRRALRHMVGLAMETHLTTATLDTRAAARLAQELLDLGAEDRLTTLAGGRALASCATLVDLDDAVAQSERPRLSDHWLSLAVTAFQRAAKLGHRDFLALRRLPSFKLLQQRPAFQALLRQTGKAK